MQVQVQVSKLGANFFVTRNISSTKELVVILTFMLYALLCLPYIVYTVKISINLLAQRLLVTIGKIGLCSETVKLLWQKYLAIKSKLMPPIFYVLTDKNFANAV
jgi:hypothetical protein